MKVLITGGTGFIGSHLARRLRDHDHEVRILGRSHERAELLRLDNIETVLADIRDPDAVDRAAGSVDTIIHLAAEYRHEGLPIRHFHEVNAGGTRNVVRACERQDVQRLVHVSTTGVYGRVSRPPADEQHPLAPADHYQKTKLEGELVASEAGRNRLRGRVVIVRPTGAYGPGDLRFLKLYRWIAGQRFIYPGSCQVYYQPSYIDDLIDGLELAATHPNAPGGIFNLGGGDHLTIENFICAIARVLGVREPRRHLPLWPLRLAAPVIETACRATGIEPPIFRRRVAFFHTHRAYTIDKISSELGYRPRVGLEEGIRRTAVWYQDNGYLPRELKIDREYGGR